MAKNKFDLVTQADIADMYGLSKQRISQLTNDPELGFPPPAYIGNRLRLWERTAVRTWGQDNGYLRRF